MDNNKKDVLRIITPCGHGFCAECLAKHMAAPPAAAGADDDANVTPVCPTCRGAIASVITPYF